MVANSGVKNVIDLKLVFKIVEDSSHAYPSLGINAMILVAICHFFAFLLLVFATAIWNGNGQRFPMKTLNHKSIQHCALKVRL
jgi:hypothetical protein